MNKLIWSFLLITAITALSACGSSGDSDEPDFDMTGPWIVSIVPGRSFLIDITSQDSGRFSGFGGAYLVEGEVEGNLVSMSIYIPGPVNCGIFIQTHTEEFRFGTGKIENVVPSNGQFGEINTTADWFTNCRLLSVEISAVKQP